MPRWIKEKRSKYLNIRITKTFFDKLNAICDKQKMDKTAFVEIAIENEIERIGK
jgi:predicted DNA-binding protein